VYGYSGNLSNVRAHLIPWGWRQYIPPKSCYQRKRRQRQAEVTQLVAWHIFDNEDGNKSFLRNVSELYRATRREILQDIRSYLLTYARGSAFPEKLPIVQPFRKFPAILWNPKVHCRVYKSPQLVPILSHFNPVPTIPSYLSKIHFNIIHPPTSSSSRSPFQIGVDW
jgi:hypothetical protein